MWNFPDPEKLHLLAVIGNGAFGVIHKAIWKGSIVAAKVIMLAGNAKIVDNELNSYRLVFFFLLFFNIMYLWIVVPQ